MQPVAPGLAREQSRRLGGQEVVVHAPELGGATGAFLVLERDLSASTRERHDMGGGARVMSVVHRLAARRQGEDESDRCDEEREGTGLAVRDTRILGTSSSPSKRLGKRLHVNPLAMSGSGGIMNA